MSHDLHSLHNKANESLVRNLSQWVFGMRSGTGDIGQAAEAPTERASVPADTAGIVDAGRDSRGDQSEGVKS